MFHKKCKEQCFFVVWFLKCDKGEPEFYQEMFFNYREARDFLIDIKSSFDNFQFGKIFLGKEVKDV